MIALIADTHMSKGSRRLPERCVELLGEVEVGGLTVAVIHDAGPAKGRLARMRVQFPAADAVVFGHSHMPLHEEEDGFRIFNPGSPTERRRAPGFSMGLLNAERRQLIFEHVWL